MKRFEFKLGRLAKVRRIEEEIARAAWQAAETDARHADQRLEEARAEVGSATQSLRAAQADPQISPLDILNIDASITRLARRVTLFEQEAERLRLAAALKRKPWQKLRTELEGLSRLEEKARTKHRIEFERQESMKMDQLASERAARGDGFFQRGPAPQPTPEPWRTSA